MPNKGGKSKRGFAAMSDEKQREIASMGGKASHGGGRKAGSGNGGRPALFCRPAEPRGLGNCAKRFVAFSGSGWNGCSSAVV